MMKMREECAKSGCFTSCTRECEKRAFCARHDCDIDCEYGTSFGCAWQSAHPEQCWEESEETAK